MLVTPPTVTVTCFWYRHSTGAREIFFPNRTRKEISADGKNVVVKFFNGDRKHIQPDQSVVSVWRTATTFSAVCVTELEQQPFKTSGSLLAGIFDHVFPVLRDEPIRSSPLWQINYFIWPVYLISLLLPIFCIIILFIHNYILILIIAVVVIFHYIHCLLHTVGLLLRGGSDDSHYLPWWRGDRGILQVSEHSPPWPLWPLTSL